MEPIGDLSIEATMSALGQKLPPRLLFLVSALPPKAAAAVADRGGSEGPIADIKLPVQG
jgi:hypothetical protein